MDPTLCDCCPYMGRYQDTDLQQRADHVGEQIQWHLLGKGRGSRGCCPANSCSWTCGAEGCSHSCLMRKPQAQHFTMAVPETMLCMKCGNQG